MTRFELLQAGLDLIDQGFTLIDSELKLVAWNHAFLELLDFPADMAYFGAPFESFIRYNALRCDYGPGDPEAQVQERILRAVEEFGGRAVMTSSEHRSGTDRCWEAYGKLGREYDAVINVQGDEPFIRPEQLRAIMRCFDVPGTDIATLVRPFAESDGLAALENPNSPKVVLDGESRAIYFSRSVIPYLRGVERSEWLAKHTFYKHIGMYAFRTKVLAEVTALPPSSLEKAESLEQLRWLENGYRIGVGISDVETIGIDTPEDLAAAEEFLKRMKR